MRSTPPSRPGAPGDTGRPAEGGASLRVSGPFTVEGVSPPRRPWIGDSPIGGAPEEAGTPSRRPSVADEPANAEAYSRRWSACCARMACASPTKGGQFTGSNLPNSSLHAEGEWADRRRHPPGGGLLRPPIRPHHRQTGGGQPARSLSPRLRRSGLRRFHHRRRCPGRYPGDPNPHVRSHLAHIRPDVNMGDSAQGHAQQPALHRLRPAPHRARHSGGRRIRGRHGRRGHLRPGGQHRARHRRREGGGVVPGQRLRRAYLLHHPGLLPRQTAWDKLAGAEDTVDPERFAAFSGTTSLPFQAGAHNASRSRSSTARQRGDAGLHLDGERAAMPEGRSSSQGFQPADKAHPQCSPYIEPQALDVRY